MIPLHEPLMARGAAWIPFVGSAALVAYALHLAVDHPGPALVAAGLALSWAGPVALARSRMRALLRSGDADAVLEAWDEAMGGLPHAETIGPLVRATALAANGHVDRARRALDRAARGPAWEAALEQRLVIDTLLDAFDGNASQALERAGVLSALPLPTSPVLRSRVSSLRAALSAFARAFAHATVPGDLDLLVRAGRDNPLVQWALWYAAAVVLIDRGEPARATALLREAPAWSGDSVFRAFHDEISRVAAR